MYKKTDKTITKLNKSFIKTFRKYNSLTLFDELNQISSEKIDGFLNTVHKDYDRMQNEIENELLALALLYYDDYSENGKTPINKKWVKSVLSEYNPITNYQFYNEIERKGQRFAESFISSKGSKKEIQKALRYLSVQMSQYAIDITDRAMLQAFKDSGIKQVKWNAEIDDKTCKVCMQRDNKIYNINKIPTKPHINCRCYFTAC